MKRFIKTLEPLSGLPNGFTEVEYLEFSGTQGIDTGLKGNLNTSYEIIAKTTLAIGPVCVLFGSRSSATSNNISTIYPAESGNAVNDFGNYNSTRQSYLPSSISAKLKFYNSKNKRSVTDLDTGDYNEVTTTYSTDFTTPNNLHIGLKTSGYVDAMINFSGYIYACKIWDNDVLIRDYIPCLDYNNRPCMYDLVDGKPYYNVGTDEFSYGKQIIPVEYLESTGEQYIDTGISYILGDKIELSTAPLEENVDNVIFGEYSNNVGSIELGCYQGKYRANLQSPSQIPEEARYTIGVKNTLKCIENGQWEINGVLFGSTRSVTNNNSSYLFCRNYPSSPKYSKCRVYNLNIIRNGTLICDYIPVIDENNTGYMFDKVTHSLYENKGTDAFSYGKKVYKQKLRLVEEKAGLSGLPNGFKEVEYLESKNTNDFAIDTGIIGKDGIESEVCVWFNTQVNNQCVLGSWSNASTRAWLCYTFGKKWYIGYNATNQTSMDLVPNQWNIVKLTRDASVTPGKVTLSVNNIEAGTISYTKDWNNGVNLTLFRMNNDTGGDFYGSTCRVSYCKLWDNGVLVRDYIPCLDSNNVPCMYDKVEGKVYYNVGSGEFSYGKQIIPVEYLEGTGTQYIDTGTKVNANTKLTLDYQMTDITTTTNGIFGASAGQTLQFLTQTGQAKYVFQWTPNSIMYIGTKDTNRHTVIFDIPNTNLTVDSDTLSISSFTFDYPTGNIMLFANGHLSVRGRMKVYGGKIYENNVVIRDYIPVIDEDNTGYMFDKITHSLYENKGTGSFSYGEKVYKRRLRLASEPWYKKKYDLLTYLESTGTQWIDTGVNAKTGIKTELDMMWSAGSAGNTKYIFGASGYYNMTLGTSSSSWVYGSFDNLTGGTVVDNIYYKIISSYEKSNQYVSVNDTNIITGTDARETNLGINLGLFCRKKSNGAEFLSSARLYSCKIWDNDILVRDFRPAKRKSDNKYGMLDMVTKKFYTNAGTGEFTGE